MADIQREAVRKRYTAIDRQTDTEDRDREQDRDRYIERSGEKRERREREKDRGDARIDNRYTTSFQQSKDRFGLGQIDDQPMYRLIDPPNGLPMDRVLGNLFIYPCRKTHRP